LNVILLKMNKSKRGRIVASSENRGAHSLSKELSLL